MKWSLNIKFFMVLFALSLTLTSKALEACTWERVVEANASSIRYLAIARQTNPQDLTEHQMCLLESLLQRHSMDNDIFDDLLPHITAQDIISHPDMSDLQAAMVQEVIETASLSNDVHETLLIQSILYRRRRVRDGIQYRDYAEIYRSYGWEDPIFAFSFSPEKAELVSFILRRGDTNNHYHEHRILNAILEANDVRPQDMRNVKVALMTAGRDFDYDSYSRSRSRYGGFTRTALIRNMLRDGVSRQSRNLYALVAALEHSENRIYEPQIFRGIFVKQQDMEFAPEEYQCIVDALHAYMAPGREGKSWRISYELAKMIQNRTCLNDPYFDRPYFTEHDIQHTLDKALRTLEDGGEVVVSYQCVGDSCR